MPGKDLDPADYLRPRDISTLPIGRGKTASMFYPGLVEAFLKSGEAAMEVDVEKIGRKPETVRSALAAAIRKLKVQEKVRVSFTGGDVILIAK